MDKILQRLIGQMTGVFSKSEVFRTKMTSKLSNVNLKTLLERYIITGKKRATVSKIDMLKVNLSKEAPDVVRNHILAHPLPRKTNKQSFSLKTNGDRAAPLHLQVASH